MTAKTNRISRPQTGDDTDMHFRAAKRHEELVEEVQALRRAGKIRESRGVEGRAHQVEQLLGALEGAAPASSRPS
jgi:hypothetical protein